MQCNPPPSELVHASTGVRLLLFLARHLLKHVRGHHWLAALEEFHLPEELLLVALELLLFLLHFVQLIPRPLPLGGWL
jgi:succinate dehydrogenase/fumarate reductase cytochrome b subunit